MEAIGPFSSAAEMLAALRSKTISAVELLDLHFAQIERLNPALNALVIRCDEDARAAALAADQARARGDDRPLLGLPFTVKDWIEVQGMPSTAGDPGLAQSGYTASSDAPVIARLRAAGGLVLGKTNMTTWGGGGDCDNLVFGRTNNPWNLAYSPGGSTGGGAAAVSAGLSALEIGNDIGGSVRIPPAFCGVYGLKPSETAWPRSGQTPSSSGRILPNDAARLAALGPIARSADDLALALAAAAGPDAGEATAWKLLLPPARHNRLDQFRVAFLPPLAWLPVDAAILDAMDCLADQLRQSGAQVAESQPEGLGDLSEMYILYLLAASASLLSNMPAEKRSEIAEWYRAEGEKRGDRFMAAGAGIFTAYANDYVRWFGQREVYRAAFRSFFQDWDVLITPATFTVPFPHSAISAGADPDDIYLPVETREGLAQAALLRMGAHASLATLCGLPAVSFPVGRTASGLPVGLQAIGPYLEDHTPLRFAALVGQAFGGYQPPPLAGSLGLPD